MASPEATHQLSPAETNKKPLEELSREDLRVLVNEAYDYSSESEDVEDDDFEGMMEGRTTLESLELMAFDKAADDAAENNQAVIEAISELRGEQGTKDTIKAYLDQLYAALHKGDRTAESEVEARFEKDLDAKRDILAAATYKGINALLPNRTEKREAKDDYNESLRLWGRWNLHGKNEAEQAELAGAIAIEEMQLLREAVDNEHEQAGQTADEKNWYERTRDRVDEFMKKGKDFTIKGKKRRITFGHIATLGLTTAGGAAVRTFIMAGAITSGGWLATVGAGAATGAIVGGIVAGARAQKATKMNLRDTVASDEGALKQGIQEGKDLSSVVSSRLENEANATRRQRSKKIGKKVLGGIGKGIVTGGVGAGIGLGAAELASRAGDVLDWAVEYKTGIDVDSIESADISTDGGNAVETPEVTEAAPDGSYEQPFSDALDPSEADTPVAEASTEDLLQHYTGENTVTIGNGEGPYETFQALGIPESQWEGLFNNQQLMDQLVANGDAYSLNDAGIQENGFGWLGNDLSPDSVQSIYEAAGMDNIDAAVDTTPVDTNLPESYQELPPEVQEFAQQKYDVVMNIESGMGGEKLMEALNADPQVWYNFEYDLLQAAPNDFYLMNDGHVGISHTGALSPEAIEALAKGLSQNSYALAA